MKELEKGLTMPSMLYTYSSKGSVLNHDFLWRLPDSSSPQESLSLNQKIILKLSEDMPVFHTRAMRREFINHFGCLMNGTKPYVLRNIYSELTKDCCSARTLEEREVDARVQEVLSAEDPDLIIDLRYFNHGPPTRYAVFWEKCTQYISEYTAVHESHHGDTCFMAKAISVRDLINQVSKLCPPNTAIPSEPWVRLNFCPQNPHAKVSELPQ